MATIYQKLAQKMRRLRKKRKLSQERLAELAKITPRSVVNIEAGKRNIKLKTLWRITKALKTKSSDLLPF